MIVFVFVHKHQGDFQQQQDSLKQMENHNKIGSIFNYQYQLEKVYRDTMVLALFF